MRSLRARLLLGAASWGVGAMAGAFAFSFLLLRHHLDELPAAQRTHIVVHPTVDAPLAAACTVLAAVLLTTGAVLLLSGLRPLSVVRGELARVRAGDAARLEAASPIEVQPLVDEINGLLAWDEVRLARARTETASLAHGLRTPLAVLALEARALDAVAPERGQRLAQELARLSNQVETHLSRAAAGSLAPPHPPRTALAPSLGRLVRTLETVHAGRGLAVELDVDAELAFRGTAEALEELVGNLLDNACKWAKERVRVAARGDGVTVRIAVEDDGSGIPEGLRARALAWGERLDPSAPGTGLGLSITAELAQASGGGLELGTSELGGLRASLRLERA